MVVISRLYPEVIKTCRPLIIEDDVLRLFVKKFTDFLEKSLTAEDASKSTIKCRETYIVDFPDGSERGSAFGLDISGKVFRLAYSTFCGERVYSISSRLYEIPESKLNGSGYKVVEYVARCVANFVETSDVKQERIILGVSVGFPMEQESLQEARLFQWTDDFKCDDFVNEDFFTQLKLALKKFKSTKNMFVIAATGDSASSLLTGLYKDPTARIGISIGNQVKVCYLEKQDNITVFPGDGIRTRAIVSIDVSAFGDDGCTEFIRTEFDEELDAGSDDKGCNTLDKLISGQHLGELFRLCLVKLINGKVILGGVLKPKVRTPGVIKSEDLAALETEDEKEFIRCKTVFRRLGYAEVSDEDCCQIRFVARCLTKRSSNLFAAFIAAVLTHLDMKEIRICADGPLLRRYPAYRIYLQKKIEKLKKPETKCILSLNEKEDLALGAGLLAFMYKDGVIKVEEKYRTLPPIRDLPGIVSCNDCEAQVSNRQLIMKPSASISS